MASGALFGSAATRSQSKHLVEFKAGKMHMKGKMVHPDKRKGLVYVYQGAEDSLMHFCWKERANATAEDDLIIFPDDIEFKKVAQCTTGRVYVLKFKSSTRKLFFWMQEPKTDKDEEFCKKINENLNNPPTPGSSRGGTAGGGGLPSDLSGLGESDLQSILGGMSQQQLMQLLGGMGGGGPGGGLASLMGGRPSSAQSTASEPPLRVQSSSPGARADSAASSNRPVTAAALPSQTATTTTAAPTAVTDTTPGTSSADSNRPAIQLSDLQDILSNMNMPVGAQGKDAIDLSQALSPDAMIPILANAEVQQRLIPFLPEGETLPKTEAELKDTIKSPQFAQALSSFSAALQSGQLGPLMTQFGFGEDVANAAAQGDLEAFVKAMQEATKKKKKDDSKTDDEKKEDEKMEH